MSKPIRLFLIVALLLVTRTLPAGQDFLVGGGSKTGVYYQVAVHMCQMMNKNGDDERRCLGRPALGSVFNINAVVQGLLAFGVAQSDRNWQATHGKGEWRTSGPVGELRSVFSVHPETVLLVTREDTGINSIDDLRGKRVNIGNPGSGQRGNAEDVLRLYGIDPVTDIRFEEMQQGAASRALVDGKIDAFFYTVGNPSDAISVPAEQTAIRIIPIDSERIRKFVASKPYYVMTTLPTGVYPGVDEPVETFAVKATVVTSAATDDALVYELVKSVFENLDEFKSSHDAFGHLERRDMLLGLSAPLHPGAARYFLESGLLPNERLLSERD